MFAEQGSKLVYRVEESNEKYRSNSSLKSESSQPIVAGLEPIRDADVHNPKSAFDN